jgi:cytochrome c biogenesis protein CcmG/thiol:disulfide interchange protein DsbE
VGVIALFGVVALGLRRTQQGTVQVGEAAPDFTLTTFPGYDYEGASQVKLSDLKGKIVVINFWASWCKPCEQEANDLEEAWLYQRKAMLFSGRGLCGHGAEAWYLEKFYYVYQRRDLGTTCRPSIKSP